MASQLIFGKFISIFLLPPGCDVSHFSHSHLKSLLHWLSKKPRDKKVFR